MKDVEVNLFTDGKQIVCLFVVMEIVRHGGVKKAQYKHQCLTKHCNASCVLCKPDNRALFVCCV